MLSNGRQRETRERQNVNGFTFQLINFSPMSGLDYSQNVNVKKKFNNRKHNGR